MPSVRVDFRACFTRRDQAASALKEQRYQIRRILDSKVAIEQATHLYQNRTGQAQLNTVAKGPSTSSGNAYICAIEMNVPYAIYLDARGFTRIRELARIARDEIRAYLEGVRAKLSK